MARIDDGGTRPWRASNPTKPTKGGATESATGIRNIGPGSAAGRITVGELEPLWLSTLTHTKPSALAPLEIAIVQSDVQVWVSPLGWTPKRPSGSAGTNNVLPPGLNPKTRPTHRLESAKIPMILGSRNHLDDRTTGPRVGDELVGVLFLSSTRMVCVGV